MQALLICLWYEDLSQHEFCTWTVFLFLEEGLWLVTSLSFYFGVNWISRQQAPKFVLLFWAYARHVFVCSTVFISQYLHLISLYTCILCVRFRRLMQNITSYPIRMSDIFLHVVSPSSFSSKSSNCFQVFFCLLIFVKAWELLLESLLLDKLISF